MRFRVYFDGGDAYDEETYQLIVTSQEDKEDDDNADNRNYIKWLISNVLGDSSKLNTYMELRLLRDITFGATSRGIAGMYFNEQAQMFTKPRYEPFGKNDAYNLMRNLGERKNHWERIRCGIN